METMNQDNVVYVDMGDDLKTILTCFKVNGISHVPVMGENKLVGMISKTDVVEYLYNKSDDLSGLTFQETLSEVKAAQVMVQPLIEASTSDSQKTICEKLFDHEVGSVVIRDDQGKIAGIVTDKDMLQYFLNNSQDDPSFTESLGGQLVQWMDQNGILRFSKALSDIGI